MQSFENQVFSVTLAGGTVLAGAVHANWRRDGGALLGRTLDLKSAYWQGAWAPATVSCAVICVYNPVGKMPELFHLTVPLSGARSSVHHFNWVAGCADLHRWWNKEDLELGPRREEDHRGTIRACG